MAEKYYVPLSDLGRIKESLMSLFFETEDITRLIMPESDNTNFTKEQNWYGGNFHKNTESQTDITTLTGHCFDIPYIEGAVSDNRCAVFIETYLTKADNQHIKEAGVDICVICHKDSLKLSDEDKEYYNSKGVYGNRVDSAVQVINSSILNPNIMDNIKENYSIGNMNLSSQNPLKQYLPKADFYGKCLSYTYQSFYKRKSYTKQVAS